MRRDRALIRNFNQLYSLKLIELKVGPLAYEATEKVFIQETGSSFYKNYASFQAARTYYNKTKSRTGVTSYRVPHR